jgi:transcriptional regulator with XRE-family HTH domain
MARNSDEHSPHPLDIALGSRVRLRRKELGFSQDQLARSVGITFQQVQKYEHGTNRISFSRLVEISEALECSVGDLIGNLDKSKSSGSFSKQVAYLTEPGASDLLEAYASIESPKRRRAILNLARQLANDQAEMAASKPAARRGARA